MQDLWFRGQSSISNICYGEETKSSFENAAKRLFKGTPSLKVREEAPVYLKSVFNKAIDFSVSDGEKTVLVEVDGILHYVRNHVTGEVRHNGATLFRSAALHKFAPNDVILRLGYKQLEKIIASDYEPEAKSFLFSGF